MVEANVKGIVERRATMSKFFEVTIFGHFTSSMRIRLCDATVPMARMAPSAVDIEAATIPIRHQAPITGGA